jgi:hypothetical protein
MNNLPDGTQFSTFIYGQGKETGSQHYCYAERYNGSVVFEDYQFNQRKPNGEVAQPTGFVNKFPFSAIHNKPDTYNRGCFIALKPLPGKVKPITVDWPKQNEIIQSPNYVIKISVSEACDNVRVNIDGVGWQQTRKQGPGSWEYDWQGITRGVHNIITESWTEAGQRSEAAPVTVTYN